MSYPRRPDAQRFLDLLEPHQRRLLILSRGLLRRQASFAELEALLVAFRKDPRAPPPSLRENAASRSENPGR